MKAPLQIVLIALIGLFFTGKSPAGLIESLNNTSDGIVIDGNRSDWVSLDAFASDSVGEAGIGEFDVDWSRITIANNADQSMYFVRYELNNNGANIVNFGGLFNMFVDTDQDRGSGYIGGGSQLPIGAEFLIQGLNVYSFGGGDDQTAFSWNFVTSLTADNSFANVDITYALPATAIGGSTDFHFVLLGDNELNGNTPDYYPDGGVQGENGDFFEYTTTPFVVEVAFAGIQLNNVFALSVSNSLTNANYRLEFAPTVAPTNWTYSGFRADGNGGDLHLFDPTGFATTKIYRVIAEF